MRYEIFGTDKHSNHQLEFKSESSSLIAATHLIFHCFNFSIVFTTISRNLMPGGYFHSWFPQYTHNNWKLSIHSSEWDIENLYTSVFFVQLFIQLWSPFSLSLSLLRSPLVSIFFKYFYCLFNGVTCNIFEWISRCIHVFEYIVWSFHEIFDTVGFSVIYVPKRIFVCHRM